VAAVPGSAGNLHVHQLLAGSFLPLFSVIELQWQHLKRFAAKVNSLQGTCRVDCQNFTFRAAA
jgi:hypothetical protein